jgi:hypothetical protein
VSDEVVQRSLIELGINRTNAAVHRCKEVLLLPSRAPGSSDAMHNCVTFGLLYLRASTD